MKKKILPIIVLICLLLSGCSNNVQEHISSSVDIYISDDVDVFGNKINEDDSIINIGNKENESSLSQESTNEEISEAKEMKVYFIDVGQADSILIQIDNDENILIDGGNNSDGEDLVDYLEYLGVKQIDTIIATHPHEDHIGGLDVVINNIPCDKIYMPYVNEEDVPTTVTYEDLLESIINNELIVIEAKNNDFIYDSGITKIQIISPDTVEPGDLNDYSIVCKVTHGNTSFMLTGDASTKINEYIMNNYDDDFLKVDVLKAGHHGSRTANNTEWISKIKPDYSVIMCEKDNQYGHPHLEALKALQNTQIYRTDEDGTILFISDGSNLTIRTKLTGDYPIGNENFNINLLP